ncbi:ROK family transcriptional regulator [Agreia sp. Leaf335]|uniref:ROK family transcriptional regulator n=1 Tax=Agreia sp. Leaf335 TaxID=1736340 RepID=UPI0006F4EFFD|nr:MULTISPECIES: ROK family protein [Microbacteriaceae]KQR19273.1 ROK family transcriptional regulator [Agreia sp. Leaf335]PPF64059.1 ROK family protein [Clavibacter michiganensis]
MTDISGHRDSNTSDLFQIMRDGQPRTRSELAQTTGLARSTVALRIDALMRLGLLRPVSDAISTGGRPSTQFSLNAAGHSVLAVDVGASHVRVAVIDLTGTVIAEGSDRLDIAEGPVAVLALVTTLGTELLKRAASRGRTLLAVGVGLPGPVEHATGRPINPPIMPGWDRYDVAGTLGAHFGVPVLVDNDVNIMALGERRLAWPEVDDLLFVKVATGIGAGVISGGTLRRGAQGTAGDLGHVYVPRGEEIYCRCGNRGCLEALASGAALGRMLQTDAESPLSSLDVIERVRQGDIDAIQAVRQAGRDIGEVLTTCVSLINPSTIVIGGSLSAAGEFLIAGVREAIYTRATPFATQHLEITRSRIGADAAIAGAGVLAIEHALSNERVDAMVSSLSE